MGILHSILLEYIPGNNCMSMTMTPSCCFFPVYIRKERQKNVNSSDFKKLLYRLFSCHLGFIKYSSVYWVNVKVCGGGGDLFLLSHRKMRVICLTDWLYVCERELNNIRNLFPKISMVRNLNFVHHYDFRFPPFM